MFSKYIHVLDEGADDPQTVHLPHTSEPRKDVLCVDVLHAYLHTTHSLLKIFNTLSRRLALASSAAFRRSLRLLVGGAIAHHGHQ